MTLREYIEIHHPEETDPSYFGGVFGCPEEYPDFDHFNLTPCGEFSEPNACEKCWNQEYVKPTWIKHNSDVRGYTDIFECPHCHRWIYTHIPQKNLDYECCPYCGKHI